MLVLCFIDLKYPISETSAVGHCSVTFLRKQALPTQPLLLTVHSWAHDSRIVTSLPVVIARAHVGENKVLDNGACYSVEAWSLILFGFVLFHFVLVYFNLLDVSGTLYH